MKNNIRKSAKRWLALVMTAIMVFAMGATVMADSYENTTEGGSTTATIAAGNLDKKTGTLTITNPATGATYNVYKVFSASVATGETTYTWTPESAFSSVLGSLTAKDISGYTAAQLKALASNLKTAATGATAAVLNSENSYNATLDLGYYLVVETGTKGLEQSQPILVAIPQVQNVEGTPTWVYDITAKPKSSSTDFTKKIAVGETLVDTSTADIGDYIQYRLYADIPTYETAAYTDPDTTLTFKITDTMSDGLTWGDSSSVSVYVVETTTGTSTIASLNGLSPIANADNANYKLTLPSSGEVGGTFTVEFTKAFLKDNAGKVVIIAFSAQLNINAKVANETGYDLTNYQNDDSDLRDDGYNKQGNPNGATLEYSNSYYGGSDVDRIKDIVTTFTFKLDVEKIEAGSSANPKYLPNAEFTVYTDATCATPYSNTKFTNPLVSSADGVVTAEGLDEGTYYLKETKAPSGYSLYDGIIKVEIIADKDGSNQYTGAYTYTITMDYGETSATETAKQTKVTVEDEKGLTMPGTGGIGTTLFTFGGLALVILAAVLFIVYTKKQRKQA